MIMDDENKKYEEEEGLGLDIDEADIESEKMDVEVYTPDVTESMVGEGKVTLSKSKSEEVEEEAFIYAIKTALGHEKTVADSFAARVKNYPELEVYAILVPPKLRGYILVEGKYNRELLNEVLTGMQYSRGLVDTGTTTPKESPIKLSEIEHYLEPKPLVSGIVEGDIVEIIAGPFKGEKARVQHVDEAKEEIVVELFEAVVSIPVTLKGEDVRVIEKEENER